MVLNGPPKTWKMITDSSQKELLDVINPNFRIKDGYDDNCVNCVITYELRQRGYDVTARPKNECNLSRKAFTVWKNTNVKEACSIAEIIDNIDANVNARYLLGIEFTNGNGHAVVLKISNMHIYIIDPQSAVKMDIVNVNPNKMWKYKYCRIDNLEITQSGYNAAKEVS